MLQTIAQSINTFFRAKAEDATEGAGDLMAIFWPASNTKGFS
jgi:hypothetical protein